MNQDTALLEVNEIQEIWKGFDSERIAFWTGTRGSLISNRVVDQKSIQLNEEIWNQVKREFQEIYQEAAKRLEEQTGKPVEYVLFRTESDRTVLNGKLANRNMLKGGRSLLEWIEGRFNDGVYDRIIDRDGSLLFSDRSGRCFTEMVLASYEELDEMHGLYGEERDTELKKFEEELRRLPAKPFYGIYCSPSEIGMYW